ncbi:MAG: response regulator [Sulfurimonas sp.]|jgi:two-component system chemotaxis response regulator CheY
MNILIVDDYQDNRMTIELLLEDLDGVIIREAVDGAEAISMCKENKFDLVFMDIMMPNVDGIEATKEIKSFSASTMIIALSALDDEKSKNLMLQSGAEDYITKPINSELFVQRVKNYMTIISMRAKPIHTTKAASLFSDTVYPLSKIFTIDSEASLAYFWDYYLNNSIGMVENISDVVRLIYGIGLWLLKTNHTFTISSQENENTLYLTQASLGSISEIVIRNILLKHCQNTPFILKDGALSFRLNKALQICQDKTSVNMKVTTQDQEILSKTHFNKITAAEYVENTAIALMDKIESLESIEDRLDVSLLDFEKESTVTNIQNVSELFLDYIEVIEELVEFEHLAYAIVSLANFLANLEESQLDEKKVKKLITLILSLISDLSSWRVNLFVKQEANDIHYLDSSLLSSCLQIESIFAEEKASEEDDNLEFF